MSAYKIAQYTSTDHLVKTTLSALPRNEQSHNFSVSYWAAASSIVLSGGVNRRVNSAQTYLMAVQTDRWQQKSFPDLNEARNNHSAHSIGEKIFVTCGWGTGRYLSGVEMLRLGSDAWTLIVPGSLDKERPSLCPDRCQ